MTIRKLATLGLAVAAALGFLHGASRHADERDAARARAGRGPGTGAGPASGPGAGPGPAAATAEELKAARDALEQADERHRLGEFELAGRSYERALSALRDRGGAEVEALRRLAARGEARATVLLRLTARIARNEFAGADDIRRLTLVGGHEVHARVIAEDPTTLTLRFASGLESAQPRSLVERDEPCPPDAWRERCRLELEARRAKLNALGELTALDLYRLAHFAIESGLRPDAVPLLHRALELDRSGLLVDMFCDPREKPSRDLIALALGEAPARPPAPSAPVAPKTGTAPKPAATRPPAPSSSADAELRRLAERFESGVKRYRESFGEGPDARRALKEALAVFREVMDGLNELRRRGVASDALEDQAVQVQRLLFDCQKRQTLDE